MGIKNNNNITPPNGESGNKTDEEEKKNILKVLKNAEYKLSDFRFSKFRDEIVEKKIWGSFLYMSPELFLPETPINSIENYQVDIWALGVLIFEMFFGRRPFEASSDNELSNMYKKGEYYLNLEGKESISKELLSFINMCLQKDPKRRANIRKLIKSDFINQSIEEMNKLNKEKLKEELGNLCKIDSNGNIVLDINTIYFKE
jgi:serine/threonine protein kinase